MLGKYLIHIVCSRGHSGIGEGREIDRRFVSSMDATIQTYIGLGLRDSPTVVNSVRKFVSLVSQERFRNPKQAFKIDALTVKQGFGVWTLKEG